MKKLIKESHEAKESIKAGVDRLANAVKVTLGPRGRNVLFGTDHPTITNDGVTIAREVDLKDPFEDIGAKVVQEAASKTNDVAGDGTTTATIIAQSIISEGLGTIGTSPVLLRREIEDHSKKVVEELTKLSKETSSQEEIAQVGTISSGDPEIGKTIAEAMGKVGKDGVVTVDEGSGFGLELEVTEGMQFDKGYISPYMMTSRSEAVFQNAKILLCAKNVSFIAELMPLLEKVAESGTNELVIIADDVDGEALSQLIINKMRGSFNTLAVTSPGFGDRRKELLEDIASLTGGRVFDGEINDLKSATVADLGQADKVVSTREATTIVGGKGESKSRIASIRKDIKSAESDYDKEQLQERLAKLSGGVAVIKVGAATEVELKEKKHRIEDALQATQAAVEEGILPGGGLALYLASRELPNSVLKTACEAPVKQIAQNAGKDPEEIIKKIGKDKGYDVETDSFSDPIKAGIIDPTKVTRSALQNACSVAAMLLTTEVVMVDEPKKEKDEDSLSA